MSSKSKSESVTGKRLNGARKLDTKNESFGSTATMGDRRTTVPNERKQKHASPFRIKVGCVVALRFRPQGNSLEISTSGVKRKRGQITTVQLDKDYLQSWVDPLAGRDEGLALIGKRIRCFFPKNEGKNQRILEGEVIRVFRNNNNNLEPFQVELLIEKDRLANFRFLTRIDSDVDVSKLQNENAKRNYLLEEKIKGKNKITVKVTLESPSMFGITSRDAIRWVLLKRVPPKLFQSTLEINSVFGPEKISNLNEDKLQPNAKESSKKKLDQTDAIPKKTRKNNDSSQIVVNRYCGDGNDSINQQVSNWRWLSSRFYDLVMSSSLIVSNSSNGCWSPLFIMTAITSGLVGRVLKVEPKQNENSLAIVTIKPLLLPEQTVSGRLPSHIAQELLELEGDGVEGLEIRVPVEHLIVLSFSEQVSSKDASERSKFRVLQSYSIQKDFYLPIPEKEKQIVSVNHRLDSNPSLSEDFTYLTLCHRCRRHTCHPRICTRSNECPLYNPGIGRGVWCFSCIQTLFHGTDYENDTSSSDESDDFQLPCCLGLCDCRSCTYNLGSELQQDLASTISATFKGKQQTALNKRSSLHALASSLPSVECIDFCLPTDFLGLKSLPVPRAKMITKIRRKTLRRPTNAKLFRSTKKLLEKITSTIDEANKREDAVMEDYSVFKPSCSRIDTIYDGESRNQKKVLPVRWSPTVISNSVLRNARELTVVNGGGNKNAESDKEMEKTSTNRAARANQRRLMKDVASFGSLAASSLGLLDSLATREPKLRFDRSSIHAWGVFADEPIAADEMVIEYRGELIGNAMAEKREIEYEREKIGSDYMFRVDSEVVCDATKQGNVARFINASCDPNCYTKIIQLDGNKRIVIYAKKDINVGDELCYDYKFPLEYDEKKRIPCHCGAKDCRGFMNWVRVDLLSFEYCFQRANFLFFR